MVSPIRPAVGAHVRNDPFEYSREIRNALSSGQQLQMGQQRMEMNERAMDGQEQSQIYQSEQFKREEAKYRLKTAAQLAQRFLQLPEQEREAAKQRMIQNGIPQSIGFDVETFQRTPTDTAYLEKIYGDYSSAYESMLPESERSQRAQSSENLPGGYTKVVMFDGSVQVKSPSGETLSGQEAVDAVRSAYDYGVELENRKYGAREGGKLDAQIEKRPEVEDRVTRAKKSAELAENKIGELVDQYEGIQNTISSYDEIIGLIDRGADTGAIASRLPSIRAASIELDNAVNNLGLDVIGNTTFGALSESELDFALDSAIPRNLQGPELKDWLTRKKAAQQKLADYINGAIQYLGNGGTLAGLQQQRAQQSGQNGSSQAATAKTFNWEDLPE